MKIAIVNISELANNNQRMCLSAERATGMCYNCRYYKNCNSKIIHTQFESLQKELDALDHLRNGKILEMRNKGIKKRW